MNDPTLVAVLYFLVVTLFGILGFVARSIYSGDLLPRKSFEYTTKEWKEQLEEKKKEAAEWKSHYEAERALGVNSRENREILLAVSKTMDRVLTSLPTAKDTNVGG